MDSKRNTVQYLDFLEEDTLYSKNDDSYTCYLCKATYEKDLQLAAELGKTLLERNKELEASLKHHQTVIEDQTQEIEYLTKQTAALKEVNDSRLRIYEQLEVSIQDLERANQRLNQQTVADRKQIKSLCANIEALESRCEDLQRSLDQVSVDLEREKRRSYSGNQSCSADKDSSSEEVKNELRRCINEEDDAEIKKLLQQIQEIRSSKAKEQRKIEALEQQLNVALKENRYLEEQLEALKQKEEDFKGIQEELTTLEQIRQGQLCKRCLRTTGSLCAEDLTLPLDGEDGESVVSDIDSVIENQRNEVLKQIQETLQDDSKHENPYRVLVEKYEALLKVQQQKYAIPGLRHGHLASPQNCLSLQEELQLTGKYSFNKDDVDSDECEADIQYIEVQQNSKANESQIEKRQSRRDFLEAETSSSGFSDDTSHKGTQTEVHVLPGSFLCKISDGSDCQFSIYDDASPIESRFRKTPEYRQLFKEIFLVLKRAAEAKDDGEPLPLLDDYTPMKEDLPKVPPVTPAREENTVDFFEGTSHHAGSNGGQVETKQDEGTVKLRKKGKKNKQGESKPSSEPSSVQSTPKRSASKARKRRDRMMNSPNRSREWHQQRNSLVVPLSDSLQTPGAERPKSAYEFPPVGTSASQEVAKLKILEKSYAEVLRMGRKKSTSRQAAMTTQYFYNSKCKQ